MVARKAEGEKDRKSGKKTKIKIGSYTKSGLLVLLRWIARES